MSDYVMPKVTVLDIGSESGRGCHAPDCERRADFRIALEGQVEELCEFCAGMRLAQDRQRREGGEGAWHKASM